MPLQPYGVLKGKVSRGEPVPENSNDTTPHYRATVEANNKEYEIQINVKSKKAPSELLYLVSEDFHADQITHLPGLPEGFNEITSTDRQIALDYIRGGLFDPGKMTELPYRVSGPDNDLNEKVDNYIKEAISKRAVIYVFGEPYNNRRGMHNIHMNQGNHRDFVGDDGIWQDGGILIHFEEENRWAGMFLAFQSQSWCTDDQGHSERPVSVCNHKTVRRAEAAQ
ncbi:YukJ family protein [Paenibacillus durus]|uniref:DUF2278 domain-containing protein n=1 Tax=Paenibacillus durus TaxID=44251 RepID=A0A089HRM0_PAEDU|nr:YukJ family protein [Paenibacillus durus]AIQ12993.1 hypothetical protein PDUR_14535 [Paenibacillus durus]